MAYEIIDFHVHPFINSEENFCFFNNIVNSPTDFKDDLLRAGVSRCCGSIIKKFIPNSFEDIKKLNEEAINLKEKYGDFYIPGIAVHPKFVQESIDEIKKYSNAGIKLIGELCPYLMGWREYYTEEMHAIYEEANKHNMIISFHSNSNLTLEPTIVEAVEKFPNLIFVAAHPREKELYDEHIRRLKKYDNYYLDLSGTGIARYGAVKYGVEKVGSEKFLFGTDYPIGNPKMYIEAVLYEKLKEKDYENILSENAKRILNL